MTMTLPHSDSHGARLLRCLRDLQLDDELDWPNIQPDTFDAKDSAHNQAQRIKKAEWVAFHLLRLWEPPSADLNKLFPAYEPRQSLDLRAAVFTRLAQLKKDGILPKDLTLRKTMFDDCKGPRFQELLLILGISVLSKLLDDDVRDRSITKALLLSESNVQLERLPIFDLAYRAGLSNLISDRATLRRRWQRFGRVLKMKEDEIGQRQAVHERKVDASKQVRIPRRRLERLQGHVERDWAASNEWKSIILHGDNHLPQRTMLERPYDEVWQHASEENLYRIQPAGNKSALQKLEQHIEAQNQRLAKWRQVKIGLDRAAVKSSTSERPQTAIMNATERPGTLSPELGTTVYEVQRPVSASVSNSASKRRSHKSPASPDTPSLAALTSDLDFLSIEARSQPSGIVNPKPRPSSMLVHPTLAVSTTPIRPSVQRKRSQTVVYSPQVSKRISSELSSDMDSASDAFEDDEVLDLDDDAATSIINSVLNASPSPAKVLPARKPEHLSLTERARLSMVPQRDELANRPGSSGAPPSSARQMQAPPAPLYDTCTQGVAVASLDERTRQTMALMAASMSAAQPYQAHSSSSSQSRPSTARRTTVTKRTSRSPEKRALARSETPDLSFVDESLLAENVDEDTIFMSRPRIAHSPLLGATSDDRDDLESVEDFS